MERVVAINLLAPQHLAKLFVPGMYSAKARAPWSPLPVQHTSLETFHGCAGGAAAVCGQHLWPARVQRRQPAPLQRVEAWPQGLCSQPARGAQAEMLHVLHLEAFATLCTHVWRCLNMTPAYAKHTMLIHVGGSCILTVHHADPEHPRHQGLLPGALLRGHAHGRTLFQGHEHADPGVRCGRGRPAACEDDLHCHP